MYTLQQAQHKRQINYDQKNALELTSTWISVTVFLLKHFGRY